MSFQYYKKTYQIYPEKNVKADKGLNCSA